MFVFPFPEQPLFNEYYAKDISKKRRIVNKMKGNAGVPLSPPPYGYIKNPDDPRFWVVEPEAAEVVRRIYCMALEGYGLAEIAARLAADGVVNPTYYWRSRGTSRGGSKSTVEPTKWGHTTVKKILTLQEYCGDVINFKSYSKSYKMKKRIENPEENRAIFLNVHEAIIDRQTWEKVQALRKGAEVYIADFKGGVDFPKVWHEKCRMCFTEEDLCDTLDRLVEELERRKSALKALGCPNIDAYNEIAERPLQRLIFACDEVAEMLDKTGADNERKKLLAQIENRLSTIARQGRAFGIHLILATQRPDATIIPGQIRNNMDFRVCGRADSVLSQIILDNTSAAEQIPKDARGRFITGDGIVFQGYLFDEGQL